MGTALVRIYLFLFILAICVYVMHGGHPFSGLFVLILTLPWSALAALPMSFLGVSVPGTFIIMILFGYLNARLLYRLGRKLE